MQHAIKEPDVRTPAAYGKRVRHLAIEYSAIFFTSIAGIALIVWQGRLFVTLSQRSNVETLTLAFFLVFFGYLALLTASGALGAFRVAYYALWRRTGTDAVEIEKAKARALPPAGNGNPVAGLNVLVEREGHPCEPIRLPIADEAGEVGELVITGAEMREIQRHKDGSNSLLAFAAEQINEILKERGATPEREVDVVAWKLIDDETTEQYLGMAHFAQRLERHLGAERLWPKVTLTDADLEELRRRLAAICPALRSEAFLPHWEYHGEHKLPLIPEPLGLVQLSRSERRADPVTSMGCATLIVVVSVAVLGLLVAFPPWVPGR